MPDKNDLKKVIKQWTKKADHDLKVAEHTLEIQRDCPTETVCFHSQQFAEKYLKAYLVSIKKPFPKIHSIEQLLLLVPKQFSFNISSEEKARLTGRKCQARFSLTILILPCPKCQPLFFTLFFKKTAWISRVFLSKE